MMVADTILHRYNVTPSAAYTWAPAYKRFGHKISNVHFIGPNKPWTSLPGRPAGVSNVKGKENSYDCKSFLACSMNCATH